MIFLCVFIVNKFFSARSCDGNMVVVSSTDGFCSVIKFTPDEIGKIYNEEDFDLEPLVALDESAIGKTIKHRTSLGLQCAEAKRGKIMAASISD